MALVTRAANASMDASTGQFAPQISGNLYAGEDLDAVAPCYIKNSDGKVYMSTGAAATEPAGIDGFTPQSYKNGQAVALYGKGTRFHYAASGLVPGNKLFIATTAGRLDTAATTGDAVGVAQVISATDIRVIRDND